MATEKQKMLAGELYRADDPELVEERRRCARLLRTYDGEVDPHRRRSLLERLLGAVGDGVEILSPFVCDYGYNVAVGAGSFLNYGAVILDCAPVTIGDHVQIGPAVQLLTADHPREPELRRSGLELASPVTVGANVWLGAGAIVCPGVTIGRDAIVGAGSVVTRDVPAGVVAAGNPCRVLRTL